MSSKLFFINSLPVYEKAPALGISVAKDMVVLAFVGEMLRDIVFHVHKSGHAFKACPYFEQFRGDLDMYGESFPLARVLEDAIGAADAVGYDPSEIRLDSPKAFPIPNGNLAITPGSPLADSYFLHLLSGHTDEPHRRRGAIARYFWGSLRTDARGLKCWDAPADRVDVMLAVARAFATIKLAEEKIAHDEKEQARKDRAQVFKKQFAEAYNRLDYRTALESLKRLESTGGLVIRRASGTVESTEPNEALRLMQIEGATLA